MYDARHEARGGVCAAHVVRKVVLAEGRVVRQQAADTGVPLGACLPLCFGGRLRTPASMAGYRPYEYQDKLRRRPQTPSLRV